MVATCNGRRITYNGKWAYNDKCGSYNDKWVYDSECIMINERIMNGNVRIMT